MPAFSSYSKTKTDKIDVTQMSSLWRLPLLRPHLSLFIDHDKQLRAVFTFDRHESAVSAVTQESSRKSLPDPSTFSNCTDDFISSQKNILLFQKYHCSYSHTHGFLEKQNWLTFLQVQRQHFFIEFKGELALQNQLINHMATLNRSIRTRWEEELSRHEAKFNLLKKIRTSFATRWLDYQVLITCSRS